MSLLKYFAFADAIDRNDFSCVESLLTNGSIDANARLPRPMNHPPALVYAVARGRKDVVDVLLRFGARIDDTDDDGRTACHLVPHDHADMLALLLTHRPNLELRSISGRTPLDESFMTPLGHSISTMLIEAGAPLDGVDRRHLCGLAATSTAAIQTLLRRGVVVSELRNSSSKSTPLHLAVAASAPDPAVLDMLVNECGVDLEARNTQGYTCMHIAKIRDNADAVRFLIAAGANVDCVNNLNRTPLHAMTMRDAKCTALLLAAGANAHACDSSGRTPAIEVASFLLRDQVFFRTILSLFLAVGADLDAADLADNTARQILIDHQLNVGWDDAQTRKDVETAHRMIVTARLDFVRHRAYQVCIGLQSLRLDALQMCEILQHSCGPFAQLVEFHQWWKIVTTVKHFKPR
jgi:ankyrin repeat protein